MRSRIAPTKPRAHVKAASPVAVKHGAPGRKSIAANVERIKKKIADKAPDPATPVADPALRQVRNPQTVKGQGDEHLKGAVTPMPSAAIAKWWNPTRTIPRPSSIWVMYSGSKVVSMKRAKFSNVPYALPPRTLTVTTLLGCILETTGPRVQRFRTCKKLLTCAPTSNWHATS